MKTMFSVLMFVFLCFPAAGQTTTPGAPVPTLQLDPQYQRDHAIVLLLGGTEGLEIQSHWVVLPLLGGESPETLDIEGGIAVWGRPGSYQVVCVVAEARSNGGAFEVVWHDLRARLEIVEGTPGPDPPVTPTEGLADTTKAVRAVVELVRSDRKAGEQKMIADSFAENARLSASDRDYDQTKLLEITQSNVVAEIGLNNYLKWKPVFTTIRAEIQRQMDGGKLKTKQDWVAIWTAISAGMR